MVSQRLESMATSQEAWPRYVAKINRAVAALALGTTMIFGATGSSAANSVPTEQTINSRETLDDIRLQRDQATRQAYQEAEAVIAWQQAIEKNRQAEIYLMQVIAWNNAVNNRIAYDSARWERLHECEQPDSWHAGGHFGNGLLSSGSGLGMSMDSWQMAVRDAARRGVNLPATGWDASIDQQMQAAQVFWEDEGWGWSCHV